MVLSDILSRCLFVEPLGSLKTTFLENLITKNNDLFNISIDWIIWCYGEDSAKPNFKKVEYFKGVPETVENEWMTWWWEPLIKMCVSCLQKDHTIAIYQ